ncbi:MAG TPA: hypothetical protein VIO64_02580 [Pseudobacteroides sp.]|uniref:hypothetical protein n=1 Tax=Pseudobacteroides sp. TaxID=1968840 RepID=UPI002F94C4A0
MNWKIKKIINFEFGGLWKDGYAQFGFHNTQGNNYTINTNESWFGCIDSDNNLRWTAGSKHIEDSPFHITFDLLYPVYITDTPEGKILVSSSGNKKIYKLDTSNWEIAVLIDCNEFGLTSVGNCVLDHDGNIWINDIQGCRIWQFTAEGHAIQALGNGQTGFQDEACKFGDVQFNWIYDVRLGPEGNIYVLDSKNYAVRMIDIRRKLVIPIAGTGKPGYSGDGGSALKATFGSNPNEEFDGPWSLSLDEKGNIYIGDTQNHVLRMIDRYTNIISTIAGKTFITPKERNSPLETDPLKLNLPKICSMDYYNGSLYIPDWDGDLIVLTNEYFRDSQV